MPDKNTNRIARNTVALYIRMSVMMLIGLYTSRVVLNTLGVSDFGIYNVVGGIVGMFSILTASLSSSISRYLTFELGTGNAEKLKRVFSTSLNVQLIMAIGIVIITEIVGVWFLNTRMNIPAERLPAANWVMQGSILVFVVNLLMVPYNASIIAHEKMEVFAYVSIWDAAMKLVVVFALLFSPFDKLKTYAVLLVGVSIMTTTIYWLYCRKHFEECHYHFFRDKSLLREMTAYAGWAFLGDGAWVLNTEGINILINLFFGVTLNAARGIAVTVDNMVQSFVRNFMTALNPQITKSYAAGDYAYMHRLIFFGSKYSYFLMLLFVFPLWFETKLILTLWLKLVPDYAVIFVQLTLATSLCMMLGNTLVTAISATGEIRKYELVMGTLALSNFPLTWLAFKFGLSPVSAYIIYLCIFFMMIFVRIYMAKGKIMMSGWDFIHQVLFKVGAVTVLAAIIPGLICLLQEDSIIRLLEVCVVSMLCTIISIYLIGMNHKERESIMAIITSKLRQKKDLKIEHLE
ncbi:lipopolysaccharide biosynthesis protein [Segatella buccae]|uniref:lipopolysaccharide biosynthesis protein n=1 Tax=Segatella buccae TaxID=28126 RepID=UPI003FD6E8A9